MNTVFFSVIIGMQIFQSATDIFELGPQTFISSHTNQVVRSSTLIGTSKNPDLTNFLQIKVSLLDQDFLNSNKIKSFFFGS